MNHAEFHILLRKPLYPLIVISADHLSSAFNIQELAQSCIDSTPADGGNYIIAIDSTGEEFWYAPDHYVISPGFLCKKWTKKKIVELYNGSSNCVHKETTYSTKSLSAKRLEKIILDICNILKT